MSKSIINAFASVIVRKPIVVLVLMVSLVAISSIYIGNLNIDASPDSLMLESDPDLKYYREVHREYGTDEYIIVGYKPKSSLLDKDTIAFVESISEKFRKIKGVSNVTSLSNVPLLLQIKEDEETGQTSFSNLLNETVDLTKAEEEFTTSPIYVDNLVSKDLSTTAIKVDIEKNQTLVELIEKRYELFDLLEINHDDQKIVNDLDALREQVSAERQVINQRYKEVLSEVRSILVATNNEGNFLSRRCAINW